MILSSLDFVHGKQILETKGLVEGNVVQTKHVGHDILAGLRGIVGGEVSSYTDLLETARETAIQRMSAAAEALGADAVLGMRLTSASITGGAVEIVAYGTAVSLKSAE